MELTERKAIFIRRDLRGARTDEVKLPGEARYRGTVGPRQPVMDKSQSKRDLTQWSRMWGSDFQTVARPGKQRSSFFLWKPHLQEKGGLWVSMPIREREFPWSWVACRWGGCGWGQAGWEGAVHVARQPLRGGEPLLWPSKQRAWAPPGRVTPRPLFPSLSPCFLRLPLFLSLSSFPTIVYLSVLTLPPSPIFVSREAELIKRVAIRAELPGFKFWPCNFPAGSCGTSHSASLGLILQVQMGIRTADLSGRNLGDEMECAWRAWPRVMGNDIVLGGGCCGLHSLACLGTDSGSCTGRGAVPCPHRQDHKGARGRGSWSTMTSLTRWCRLPPPSLLAPQPPSPLFSTSGPAWAPIPGNPPASHSLVLEVFTPFPLPHFPLPFPPFLQFFTPHCSSCPRVLSQGWDQEGAKGAAGLGGLEVACSFSFPPVAAAPPLSSLSLYLEVESRGL